MELVSHKCAELDGQRCSSGSASPSTSSDPTWYVSGEARRARRNATMSAGPGGPSVQQRAGRREHVAGDVDPGGQERSRRCRRRPPRAQTGRQGGADRSTSRARDEQPEEVHHLQPIKAQPWSPAQAAPAGRGYSEPATVAKTESVVRTPPAPGRERHQNCGLKMRSVDSRRARRAYRASARDEDGQFLGRAGVRSLGPRQHLVRAVVSAAEIHRAGDRERSLDLGWSRRTGRRSRLRRRGGSSGRAPRHPRAR